AFRARARRMGFGTWGSGLLSQISHESTRMRWRELRVGRPFADSLYKPEMFAPIKDELKWTPGENPRRILWQWIIAISRMPLLPAYKWGHPGQHLSRASRKLDIRCRLWRCRLA